MWEISISDSAITRSSLLHTEELKSKPAIINLHLQVSHQQDLELPYNSQAAYLLLDAIKPTHCFPGQARTRVVRKGPSLPKCSTNPLESKPPILCYSPKL